ncbi:MAG: TetR/AcrR family transcriptional regulator [Aliiglaciecola sp.]
MVSQIKRREKTRELLLSTARRLFSEEGYEQTTTNKLLVASGVSKGGMYHHFSSKQELMEAIYVEDCERVFQRIEEVSTADTALDYLIQAVLTWLNLVSEPELGSVLLAQGPKVLGWQRCREIEAKFSLQPMIETIEKCMASGQINVTSARATVQVINAMVTEMALIQLHDPSVSVEELQSMLSKMIKGLAS